MIHESTNSILKLMKVIDIPAKIALLPIFEMNGREV
jgi:hypothetical protein